MDKRRRKKGGTRSEPSWTIKGSCKEVHGAGSPEAGASYPLFGVRFNPFLQAEDDETKRQRIFAVVGSNRVSIYECTDHSGMELLQVYVDEQPNETFYTCAWTVDTRTTPHTSLLAAAGASGIIRLIEPSSHRQMRALVGHGHAINELQFHPTQLDLLLSASKDHSVRLWNVLSGVCVLVLGGERGHRDEVLSVDVNLSGSRIVSCGMDHNLMIWKLDKHENAELIEQSRHWTEEDAKQRTFPTRFEHFPVFSTSSVHRNYVDCVRWFGDMLLSKSTESCIICWIPGGRVRLDLDEKQRACLGEPTTALKTFRFSHCDIWYVRFALDAKKNTLSIGNQAGAVYVWDLSNPDHVGKDRTREILHHPKCTSAVRQLDFTIDGRTLIAVCDDGTIWRWDKRTGSAQASTEA